MPNRSSFDKVGKGLHKIQKHTATRCFCQHHHKSSESRHKQKKTKLVLIGMLIYKYHNTYICQMPATIHMGENDMQVHNPKAMATAKQIHNQQCNRNDIINMMSQSALLMKASFRLQTHRFHRMCPFLSRHISTTKELLRVEVHL